MVLSAVMFMALWGAPSDAVVLDNGAMRIEIDPGRFNVRFVGAPGGDNFLDPVFRAVRAPADAGPPPSGGLITQILPFPDDAVLANGPAEVLDQGPGYVVLLGPVSPGNGLRVRKEIRLADTEPRAVFTVTVLSEKAGPTAIVIRNEARVPIGSVLRAATGRGPLQVIEAPGPLDLQVNNLVSIAVPLADMPYRVVLGALTEALFHVRGRVTWSRQMADIHAPGNVFPDQRNAVLELDRPANNYLAAMNGASGRVTSASPVVFREIWVIEAGIPVPGAPGPDADKAPH